MKDSLSSKLDRWTMNLSIIFFIVSSFFIFIQVITRYIFAFSFHWVEELSRYLIIYMVLLGASIVLKHDEHPRVEVFYDMFSPRARYWINYLFYLLILAFLSILTWQGIESCIFEWSDYTPALRLRKSIPYSAIPIGGFLMIIQNIFLIIRNYQKHHNTDEKNKFKKEEVVK